MMRWGDVTIPATGPVLFVVAMAALVLVPVALRCTSEKDDPVRVGPEVVWEWSRGEGTIRLTSPGDVNVRLVAADAWDANEGVRDVDAVWVVRALSPGTAAIGVLTCRRASWQGPCLGPLRIDHVVGEGEQAGKHREILRRIAASYEWEPEQ